MKYRVKLQYPWTTYYEVEVEVEASNPDHAADLALEIENKTPDFWDSACSVGDGHAGDAEVWEVIPVEE